MKSIHPCQSVIQTVYDIIKAHGGEIKVETKEARPDDPCLKHSVGQTLGQERGTEFIIQLPII